VSKQIATTAESSFEPAQFCNDSEQVFSNRSKCVPVRNIGCLESVNSGARHREVAIPKCVLKKQKPPPPINSGFVLYPIDLAGRCRIEFAVARGTCNNSAPVNQVLHA